MWAKIDIHRIRSPTLDKLAAGFSMVPASLFFVLLTVAFAMRKVPGATVFYLIVAMGLLLVAVACETFKWISRPLLPRYKWLARPADAPANCGMGIGTFRISSVPFLVAPTLPTALSHLEANTATALRPGMPSTHQALMTFFAFSMILFHGRQTAWLIPLWVVLLLVNIGVGWSRVYTRCHTLPQVWAGTGVGLALASMFYAVVPAPRAS